MRWSCSYLGHTEQAPEGWAAWLRPHSLSAEGQRRSGVIFTEEGHGGHAEKVSDMRCGGSAMSNKSSAWRIQSWPFDLGCLSSPS